MQEFKQYVHHNKVVWVREFLRGQHRKYCLCHKCEKLDILDRNKNCSIANQLYRICCKYNVVTPVWECSLFRERNNGSTTKT